MKNRKDRPISFGVTLTSSRRKNIDHSKAIETDCRDNASPVEPEVLPHEIDCPRRKLPLPGKPPFTPDMLNCESVRLPSLPQPRKMSKEEERIHKELERLRSRTAPQPSSGKPSSMAVPVAWDFLKVVFVGVFVAFKYIFIAVAFIITIGCFICAGRQTSGLK